MRKAISLGLITEEQRQVKYKDLYKLMLIRKRYRKYFAGRKFTDLMRLVLYPKVSMRMKAHYIKEHWEYKNCKQRMGDYIG